MYIRKATVEDSKQIAKVHINSWKTTYKGIISDSYLASLSYEKKEKFWRNVSNLDNVLVAVLNGEIVGFITYGPTRFPHLPYDGEVYAFYLLQKAQRQGIGTKMFKEAAKELKKQDLNSFLVWVMEKNPSKSFYETFNPKIVQYEDIKIDGETYCEVAFGYDSVEKVLSPK
ncbi:GNAT family N-acetyltransferase [Bacillus kexueae]|uniref:GNAT family N-acetyltransferase n=1 Tax=Aeribacillus kexueae TaxID=2078952 RepID=UPI001FAF4BC0|nr:GNAT family N-acetyltransferase [Bacillus kexueae]